jgi:hypothetical protein
MPVVAFAVAVALARHSRESGNPVTLPLQSPLFLLVIPAKAGIQ